MDFNKAIEFIRELKLPVIECKDIRCINTNEIFSETEVRNNNITLDNIISVLERGKKYEAMWESIESAKINDKTIQKAIRILIKGIKEGYKK